MTFFPSYSVFLLVHVRALLILFAYTLCFASTAAGAPPLNTTLPFDSPQVSFSRKWKVGLFQGQHRFAFVNEPNERLQVLLPENTSAIFYQGFVSSKGALFSVCIDCNGTDSQNHTVNVDVDAHDDTDDGSQPPETLFSFTDLDPAVPHILDVVNLVDARFDNTSLLTFDSLIVTTGSLADNSTTITTTSDSITSASSTATSADPGSTTAPVSTIVVTQIGGPLRPLPSQESSVTSGGGGDSTVVTSRPTDVTSTTTSTVSVISAPPATPTDTGSSSGTATTTASESLPTPPGSSSTGSATSDPSNPPSQTSGGASTTSGPGTTTVSESPPPSRGGPTDTSGSLTPSSSSGTPQSTGGVGSSGGSVSPVTTAPAPTGTSANDNNGSSSTVSKPVIIAVAVIASLVVLGLLAGIVWLLVRTQPPVGDAESGARGGGSLMREAAPLGREISAPLAVAIPARPDNPFADSVPADVPIDSPTAVLAMPPPRPPPPPLPPKSPLRNNFNSGGRPPAWITRVPRTPSPND